jgi:hypothetical protein
MRASLLAFALGALGAAAVGCTSGQPQGPAASPAAPTGFATYHSAEKGFAITFPANWARKEKLKSAAVAAISPADGPGDQVRESVAVAVEDLPAGITLDAYDQASHQKIRAFLQKDGYEEQEHLRVKLGGAEAARLVYSHHKDGRPLKLITWLAVKGNRGYAISCIAAPKDFDRYLPQFEQIAGSLTVY